MHIYLYNFWYFPLLKKEWGGGGALTGLFLSLIDAFLPLTVFAGLVPINVFIETKQCTRRASVEYIKCECRLNK